METVEINLLISIHLSMRGSWTLDFSAAPWTPPTRGSWNLDISDSPRDPPIRGSWTMGSENQPSDDLGGGHYKVTFVLECRDACALL